MLVSTNDLIRFSRHLLKLTENKKTELILLFYNNIVIHVMCRTNIPLYKNMTKERTTRQTFVNLVGKFVFHKIQIRPDKLTFIPRITRGENELISGFASSIHSLRSPQAVQMPSKRFNAKMTNNIRLISNKCFIICHSSLESQSLLFYFFERSIQSTFCVFLSNSPSLNQLITETLILYS